MTGPLLTYTSTGRNGVSTNYPEKSEMLKKRGKKQSVLSSVLVMNGEEVFKFVNRLARDCGFFQLVPVSHSQSTRQRLWILPACPGLSQSIDSPETVDSSSLSRSLTVNRLARDCGFFQFVPVSHSPGEESVFCTRLSYQVLL